MGFLNLVGGLAAELHVNLGVIWNISQALLGLDIVYKALQPYRIIYASIAMLFKVSLAEKHPKAFFVPQSEVAGLILCLLLHLKTLCLREPMVLVEYARECLGWRVEDEV